MANDLNNLLDRVERVDGSLAAELRAQIAGLARRREFGLNFEGRDKTLRSLDLKDPAVRSAILAAEKTGKSAADLFNGPHSRAY